MSRKKFVLIGVGVAVAVAAAVWGAGYWTHGRFMVHTDDAYVQADIALISSRVQGYVAEVPVEANDRVAAGDVLVRLDDGDYAIALKVAQSKLATVGQTVLRIEAQTEAARAAVTSAEAEVSGAEAQQRNAATSAERARNLAANRAASQASLDAANEGLDTATANLAKARAAVLSAKAQIAVLEAQRAETEGSRQEAELQVAQAQRNLDLTVLRAPTDGTVANMTLEVGDLVSPGARLAALVPTEGLYVEANFKETQMPGIRQGAVVHLSFDALPGQEFEGHVASTAPATGAVFSLLPAENATGNFTKVVQRVPVRIAIPDAAQGALRAGLSVIAEVDSRTGGE